MTQSNNCNSWIKHILELKQNCSKKMLSNIENDIMSSSKNLYTNPLAHEEKLQQMQNNIMNEEKHKSKIKQSLLENQFEEFKNQAKILLDNEDSYEKKLEEQERERIEAEENMMKKSTYKEQIIANRLIDDIQNIAQTDTNYNIKEMSIKRDMRNMMADVENQITQKRQKLLERIQRMRTMHEITQRNSGKDLLNMKRDLGNRINQISKSGNPSQCFIKDSYSINIYCTKNFQDFQLQLECKKDKQFCYMCCENEIGTLKKVNLNCCYSRCDGVYTGSECREFEQTSVNMNPISITIAHPDPFPILPINSSFNTV